MIRSYVIIFLIFSCSKLEDLPEKREIMKRPAMLFKDTTLLDFHEKGRLVWRMKTLYLERWAGSERIFGKPIQVEIYDSLGLQVAFLTADSGNIDKKMTFISASGHVKLKSAKGAVIQADSLIWDKESNRVRTDSRVRVLSEYGDVLSGQGFISDANLENWQIMSDVKAILQDAGKQMEQAF